MSRRYLGRATGAAVLAGAMFLAFGCGGGGGGGGIGVEYGGKTEKAVVTEDNAQELVGVAMAGGETSRDLGFVGGDIAFRSAARTVRAPSSDLPLGAARLATRLIGQEMEPARRTYRRMEFDESMDGSCGGSIWIRGSGDDETGVFQGTFSFENFCEGGVIFSGSISMNGQVDIDTGEFLQLKLTIPVLSVQGGETDVAMGGSLSYTFGGTATTAVIDLTVRDNGAGEAIRLEDFVVGSVEVAGGERVTVTGRAFHSAHGHVDVTTATPFLVAFGDDVPSSGVLRADGADGTWVRLTAVSSTHYRLEADTDGDSTPDWDSGLVPWGDL
ncbi:MAG: hypothetical protein SCH98_13575 [Deferrisomatales bacterium]|nr:hypothetical protein [Deferrisomatales bacterium]